MKCENVWVSRHGVRAGQTPASRLHNDEPEAAYDGPSYDKPLSPLGRRQATALAERLSDAPIDFIFTSPFRRTIESVAPLAQRLNLSIKLEWGLGEILREDWFEALPSLPGAAERHREFPAVDAAYRSLVMPRYPESREQFWRRTERAAELLTQSFGPGIFLMGHGASSQGVRRALLRRDPPFNVDFCGLSHLQRAGEEWRYLLDGDTAHLAAKGLRVSGRR